MPPPSNAAILGHSKDVWSAKKKWKTQQVQEVVFDDDARTEFLTGFRKRKLLKKQDVVSRAKERDRLERLRQRAEKRKDLKERARENYRQVEAALGGEVLDGALGVEAGDQVADADEREEEYEGEEMFASVTVVEDFDPASVDDPRPSFKPLSETLDAESSSRPKRPDKRAIKPAQKKTTKAKPKTFKYETKAARKSAKDKERKRRKEKDGEPAGRKPLRKGKRK